jgi:drug/metabolite transporter (DMT)-like permease
VLSWAAFSLIGKTILKGLSPLSAITYSTLAGTALLFVPAYLNGLLQNVWHYPLEAWLGVFYLGFFGTVVGFVWYYEGIRSIGPTKASLFINFVPISAVILAFIVLKEPLTKSLLTGTVLVSLGVYLTHIKFSLGKGRLFD